MNWAEPRSWVSHISQFLRPRLRQHAIESWQSRENRADLCCDDSEWKTMLVEQLDEEYDITADALSRAFEDVRMRAYHGCRPTDPAAYTQVGIRVANWNDRMRALTVTLDELRLSRAERDEILAKAQGRREAPDIDIGKIFLAIDERHLIKNCGHYLLLGSEWQAARLGNSHYQALRQRGVPTSFHIDFPLSWISDSARLELAEQVLAEWVRLKTLALSETKKLDFTFTLRRNIPANLIVGHIHPEAITDYHTGGTVRRYARATCALCSPRL